MEELVDRKISLGVSDFGGLAKKGAIYTLRQSIESNTSVAAARTFDAASYNSGSSFIYNAVKEEIGGNLLLLLLKDGFDHLSCGHWIVASCFRVNF